MSIWKYLKTFFNLHNLKREVLGYILTSAELCMMSSVNSIKKVAEMSLYELEADQN